MHATICDLILDVVQNSIEANASKIELSIRERAGRFEFCVRDNGRGMSEDKRAKAIDPFYSDGKKHAHRRVGLGLPFLFQTAEAANGRVELHSDETCGTQIVFSAQAAHVDLPPFGDFAGAAAMLMAQMHSGELTIRHETECDGYALSRSELVEALGELTQAQNLTLLKTYIRSQEEHLRKAG